MNFSLDCPSLFVRSRLPHILMRAIVLLFCSVAFAITPNDLLSQDAKISFETDQVLTVDEFFDLLEKQTDYKFIYQEGIFDHYPTLRVKRGSINPNKLIKRILAGANLEVSIGKDNIILVKPAEVSKQKSFDTILKSQEYTIVGTVVDESNLPLPGASVVEQGTLNGTQTDFDGNFTLKVSNDDANLEISYLGYGSQVVPVKNNLTLNIQLIPSTSSLEEVIVTGYGTQVRKTLSSSISKVDGEQLEGLPVPSFEAALQGRASGLQVTTGGAMSGAPVKIRIRGSNSATGGSDPLYVIDGVVIESGAQSNTNPVNGFYMDFGTNVLASINPNDIESIEVLKDAAATSIYGARGSNGVIIITTKKGSRGKTKVNLVLDSGISDPTNRLEYVNTKEYLALASEAWYYAGNNPAEFWEQSGVLADGLTKEEALRTDTNWQDQALGSGFSTNLNLSASGGDEKTRFYISAGMLNENSIFIGNEYQRISTRTNIEHSITPRLKIGTTLTYTDIVNNPIPVQEGLGKATNALPIWPVKKSDGTYFRPIDNVRASIDLWDIEIKSKQLIASWYLNYKLFEGLNFTSNYGLNSLNTTNQQYRDALLNYDGLATALVDQGDRKSWNFKNLLNYTKRAGNHNFDFLLGMEAQKTTQYASVISGQGFVNSTLKTPQDAAQITSNYSESAYTFMSYLTRLNYDYKGKYLLSLTARRDGSSRFGKNNQWGFFPAVSLGYILSEEPFFKPLKSTVNFFKLRASLGLSGNAEIGNYLFASTYAQSNYNANSGITLANIGDDKLGWETTEQRDLGISLELFDGRIRIEGDYYDKLTTDLLLPFPVSVVSGLTQVTTNLGQISNKGYEILLGAGIVEREDFSWDAEITFSRNKNIVLDIGENVDGLNIPGFGTTSIYVGKPIGIQTLPIWVGVDPASGLDIYSDTDGNQLRQDQAIAEYGSLNAFLNANLQPYGNPFPDFVGGFSNRFNWKDFYASVLFTFEYGADYIAAGEAINTKYAFSSFTSTPLRYALNRWRNPGDITEIGRLTTDPTIYTRTSEFISDVDFIRMKDLTFGYILKPKSARTFESLNIYTKFTNYLTFTNAKPWIYDPENYRSGGNLNLLERWKSAPQAKTITLGLNINF